jgi:hypothetical protein
MDAGLQVQKAVLKHRSPDASRRTGSRTARSVWSAACSPPLSHGPSEIIFHLHAVNLESINGFQLRW